MYLKCLVDIYKKALFRATKFEEVWELLPKFKMSKLLKQNSYFKFVLKMTENFETIMNEYDMSMTSENSDSIFCQKIPIISGVSRENRKN